MSLDNVKIRKPIFNGMQLIYELDLLRQRASTCKMHGKALVDGEVMVEADLMAAITDR